MISSRISDSNLIRTKHVFFCLNLSTIRRQTFDSHKKKRQWAVDCEKNGPSYVLQNWTFDHNQFQKYQTSLIWYVRAVGF